MTQNRIIFEVIAEGKNLKVVQRDVEAIAQGIGNTSAARQKAGASQRDYNAREKAIYQGNLASAKSFSKLTESIAGSGSSSLVNAYATLAANLFAATAAFNALKSASEAQQVAKGLEFIGNSLGVNLREVSKQLVEITGHAITLEDAMRATALATKAGFSIPQLKDLALVARGASTALGRDLADSFDRVIRGVAKLEPEILDELGLVVRIEEATTKYAAALGKTREELTSRQRIQAFANETIEQGLQAYSAVANAVDVDPYAKILASLNSLGKALATLINNSGLTEFITYLSQNTLALAGAVSVFVSSISKQMLPVLYTIPVRAAKAASAVAVAAQKTTAEALSNLPATVGKLISTDIKNKILEGLADNNDIINAIGSVQKDIADRQQKLDSGNFNKRAKGSLVRAINSRREAVAQLTKVLAENQLATARVDSANALLALSQGSVISGVKAGIVAVGSYNTALQLAGKNLIFLRTAAFAAAAGVRAVSALFLRFLPVIGIILTLIPLFELAMDKLFPESELEKKKKKTQEFFEGIQTNLSHIGDSVSQFEVTFKEDGIEKTKASVKVLAGLMSSVNTEILRIIKDVNSEQRKAVEDNNTKLKELFDELKEAQKDIASGTLGSSIQGFFDKYFKDFGKALHFWETWELLGVKSIDNINKKIQETFDKGIELMGPEEKLKSQEKILTGMATAIESLTVDLEGSTLAATDHGRALKDRLSTELVNVTGLVGEMNQGFKNSKIIDDTINNSRIRISALTDEVNNLDSSYSNLTEGANAVRDALAKISRKGDTPFTEAIQKTRELKNLLSTKNFDTPEFKKLIEELKELAGIKLSSSTGFKDVDVLLSKLENADSSFRNIDSITKELSTVKSVIAKLDIDTVGIKQIEVDLERQILDAKINQIKQQREFIKGDKEKEREKTAEINALDYERSLLSVKLLEVNKETIKLQNQALSNLKEELSVQEAIAKLDQAKEKAFSLTQKTDPNNELSNIQQQIQGKRVIQRVETEIARSRLEVEQLIAEERLASVIRELKLRGDPESDSAVIKLEKIQKLQNDAFNREIRNLDTVRDKKLEQLDIEENIAMFKFLERPILSVGSGSKEVNSTKEYMNNLKAGFTAIQELVNNNKLTELQGTFQQIMLSVSLTRERFVAFAEEFGEDGAFASSIAIFGEIFTNGFVSAFDSIKTKFDEFKMSIGDSTLSIGEAWDKMGLKEKTGIAADGLNYMASLTSALGEVSQASAQKKIAAIDSEIAIEQKRDGKSAASVAKIQALEAKKEKAQRKAFEQKKKVTMAEIVMSTAAAVMEYAKIPFVGWVMAAAVAALGAAQLAVVAGSSYQGGGSVGSVAGASALSVGERSNKVDVSKQTSSGELSYIQGAQGRGTTANDFKPAFVGSRYRANGGYVVGEQGPELFTPEVPGVITPADKVSPSQNINVSFAVSAIDTTNMKQMLENQKGNIIDMIRQAANVHGEEFLESVDTMSMAPTRMGFGRLA